MAITHSLFLLLTKSLWDACFLVAVLIFCFTFYFTHKPVVHWANTLAFSKFSACATVHTLFCNMFPENVLGWIWDRSIGVYGPCHRIHSKMSRAFTNNRMPLLLVTVTTTPRLFSGLDRTALETILGNFV
jgi:hypothetical protein